MSTNPLDIPLEELTPAPTTINDNNKVYSIAAACIALGIISSLFVLIRLASRAWNNSFGHDDGAAVVALIFLIGWTAFAGYINLNAGVGKPLWETTMGEWSLFWEGILTSMFIYPSMSGSIRVSTVFFYRRLFSHDRVVSTILWIMLGFQIVYIIAFTITPAFICKPIWKIREPLEVLQYCSFEYYAANQTSVYVVSIALDLILAIFPLVIVYKLHLPGKKRLSAALIFLFGASATVASIYKFAIHIEEGEHPQAADPQWYGYLLSRFIPVQFARYGHTFWIPCQVEPSIALIGLSLPAIRQLYFKLRGRDLPPTVGSRTQEYTGNSNKSQQKGSQQSSSRKFYQIRGESEIELQNLER